MSFESNTGLSKAIMQASVMHIFLFGLAIVLGMQFWHKTDHSPKIQAHFKTEAQELTAIEPLNKQAQVQVDKSVGPTRIDADVEQELDEWEQYLAKFRNHIESRAQLLLTLPQFAHIPQGRVKLLVAINTNGTMLYSHIAQSSGNENLDMLALELAYRCQPYPPLPEGITDSSKVVEILRLWQFN